MSFSDVQQHPLARRLALLTGGVLAVFLLAGVLQDRALGRYGIGGPVSREIHEHLEALDLLQGLQRDVNASRALLLSLPSGSQEWQRQTLRAHREMARAIDARFDRAFNTPLPTEVHLLLTAAEAHWRRYLRAVEGRIHPEEAPITPETLQPFVDGQQGRQFVRLLEQIEAGANIVELQTGEAQDRAAGAVTRGRLALRLMGITLAALLLALLVGGMRSIVEPMARHDRQARHEALRADVAGALAEPGAPEQALPGCAEAMVRHLGAGLARIWLLDPAGEALELKASAGTSAQLDGAHARITVASGGIGGLLAVPLQAGALATPGLVEDAAVAQRDGLLHLTGHPLGLGDRRVGAVALYTKRPLHPEDVEALRIVADALAQGLERRRAEQALAQRADELARSNAELERFAYVASHDLQEPLRMVASYTRLLARRYTGKLDSDADEYIQFAVDGAVRMQRLIEALLTYSRVGTSGKKLVPVQTGEVVKRVLRNLGAAVKESGADVQVDALPPVMGDEVQCEQLFQNLVANAIKFRKGTPRIQIRAERSPSEPTWRFSVADDGIGIDPQYYERIFVLFQRLHTQEEFAGTGIGLAVCKKIVERHGGRIWVESTAGQGSTFYFTLRAAEESGGVSRASA